MGNSPEPQPVASPSAISKILSSFKATVRSAADWLRPFNERAAELFNTSAQKILNIEISAGLLTIGFTMIQIEEYIVSATTWVLLSGLWSYKALSAKAADGNPRRFSVRIILLLLSIFVAVYLITLTNLRRGDKDWSNFSRLLTKISPSPPDLVFKAPTPPHPPESAYHTPEPPPAPRVVPKVVPEVIITFKDSPAFTDVRKQAVIMAFDGFRRYLISVGFDIPKELPPIGVAKGLMLAGDPRNKNVYNSLIVISEESLDDPKANVATIYASYTFGGLIPDASNNVRDAQPTGEAVRIFADYFRDSYIGKHFPWQPSPEAEKWESTLWSLRRTHGQQFVDKAMFFAVKRWVPYGAFPVDDITVDSFLASRIEDGFAVLDNNGSVLNWFRPFIADRLNRVSSPEEKAARLQTAREKLGELLTTGSSLRGGVCSQRDVRTPACQEARTRLEQQVANVLRFEVGTASEAQWRSEVPPQSMLNYSGMATDVVNLGKLLDTIR